MGFYQEWKNPRKNEATKNWSELRNNLDDSDIIPDYSVLKVMKSCIDEGNFPEMWKKSKVILKDEAKPPNYRPICLLSTAGKLKYA